MARIEATAVSFRPLQLRLKDVASQIGDAREFIVHVLDRAGTRHTVRIELIEKWGGSWRWELRCQKCQGPARVLHLQGDFMACNRCSHYLTPHQRHKRASTWSSEGALADRLIKDVLAGGSSKATLRRIAGQLERNATTESNEVLALARRFIDAASQLSLV